MICSTLEIWAILTRLKVLRKIPLRMKMKFWKILRTKIKARPKRARNQIPLPPRSRHFLILCLISIRATRFLLTDKIWTIMPRLKTRFLSRRNPQILKMRIQLPMQMTALIWATLMISAIFLRRKIQPRMKARFRKILRRKIKARPPQAKSNLPLLPKRLLPMTVST